MDDSVTLSDHAVSKTGQMLPYPEGRSMRALFRAPLLGWRLGLGRILGHPFLVITTRGRRSGVPRRAVLEYRVLRGKIYVISGFGSRASWYQNLVADPRVTVQTWQGPESMVASRITDADALRDVYDLFMRQYPVFFRQYLLSLSIQPDDLDAFIALKDRAFVLRFDPTDAPTPPPLEADLAWVWPLAFVLASLWWVARRRRKHG